MDVDCLVVGAGVGGALLGLLLGRRGQRVVVVEASPSLRTGGADFLKPRGLRLIRDHGLMADLRSRGSLERSVIDFYHDGTPILLYDFTEHTETGHFVIVPYVETVGAILSGCKDLPNVDVRFGSRVVDIVATDEAVTEAMLDDGTKLRARTFVDSTGRSPLHAFVDPRVKALAPYPHVLRMATTKLTSSVAERNRLYFSSDGWFAYFYPLTYDSARLFVGVPRELDASVFESRDIDLTSHLESFVSDSRDVFPLIDAGAFLRAPISAFTCEQYHRGNVILMGGGAFACHPMTGQGMSYTMEDATILAGILAENDSGNLSRALGERYETRRSLHAELVSYGDRLARSYHDREAYQRVHHAGRHGGEL
nr:FAD-dependent monooxygenase [Micromonospora sp. Llam0]